MSADEKRSTEIREYTRRVVLDATAEACAHAEILQRLDEEDRIEAEAAASRKEFAERIKAVRARLRALRAALETGELLETARCYERVDPDRGVAEFVKADGSGEVFDSRELTPREKQGGFRW